MAESVTATELVSRALLKLRVYEATETLSAEDLAHGLVVLNEMLGDWSRQGLVVCADEFADATTAYTYPDGYNRALRLNLAVELAADYGAAPTPELLKDSKDALNKIKRANWQIREMSVDAALTGQASTGYDILSDQ